jgi:hypothetical protein
LLLVSLTHQVCRNIPEAVSRKVIILRSRQLSNLAQGRLGAHSRSGSCEMNSVTYFKVAGMTPAAPFVLSHQFSHIFILSLRWKDIRSSNDPSTRSIHFIHLSLTTPSLIQTGTHSNSHTAQILDSRKHGCIPPRDHREIMIPLPNPLSSSFSQGSRGRHDFSSFSFCSLM